MAVMYYPGLGRFEDPCSAARMQSVECPRGYAR